MSYPLRAGVPASIREFLLSDSVLIELLNHTDTDNKVTVDKTDYDTDLPFVNIELFRGAHENSDPYVSFDILVNVMVHGKDLSQVYDVYGRIETILADCSLPTGFGWRYYAPVRLTNASYFETFKRMQQDFYSVGGTFRVRGVRHDGN